MKACSIPADEKLRLAKLRALALLDSAQDERFDRITRLAQRLFDMPVAAVMLIDADRQWCLSAQGMARSVQPRAASLCGHAILAAESLVVADTQLDPRFDALDLQPGLDTPLRFYAGAPLRLDPEGSALGTLCLMDTWPRAFATVDLGVLRDLADLVERELQSVLHSLSDAATGLANQRAFEELGQKALMICARAHAPAALIRFDLESVAAAAQGPDAVASDEEDSVRQFARLLRGSFRSSDVLARLDGQQFVALVTHCSEPYLRVVIERLRTALFQHNREQSRKHALTPALHFSAAVRALMPTPQTTLTQIMTQLSAQLSGQLAPSRVAMQQLSLDAHATPTAL